MKTAKMRLWSRCGGGRVRAKDAVVTRAAGDALLVQMLEDGEHVFASGAEQIAGVGDGDGVVRAQVARDATHGFVVGRASEQNDVADLEERAALDERCQHLWPYGCLYVRAVGRTERVALESLQQGSDGKLLL